MNTTTYIDAYQDAFLAQEALEKSLADAIDRLGEARKNKDTERVTRERLSAEGVAKDLETAMDRTEQARLAYWRALLDESLVKLEAEITPLLNEAACYWRLSMRSVSFTYSGIFNGLLQCVDDRMLDLAKHPVPVASVTSRGLERADREI